MDRGGRPSDSGRTLSVEQEREVQRLIRDRTPDKLKMVYALWTRQAVAELIRERYSIELAVRTMVLYLGRWVFTPQKPMKKADEKSPTAVEKWLDEEYPAIAASARVEGAEIHWGDETGLRSDDMRGRSDVPLGQTPVIRVNSKLNKRHGLSVISTVTNESQMRWKVFDGALDSAVLIHFLRHVIKNASKKICLILDNLRVHHSKRVKARLAEHKTAIEVFYLPSYSPELNSNAVANADLKQAVTTLAPARTKLTTRQSHFQTPAQRAAQAPTNQELLPTQAGPVCGLSSIV